MNTCVFKFTENQIIVCNCLLCLRWLNFTTTPSVHLYKFCILVMFKFALKFLKWLKLLSNFKIEGLDSLIRVHFKIPKWTTCLDNIHGEHFSAPLAQALVSFKKYMPPPLPYFKVNICLLPLPHFASIFFAYLWSFRWPNYIVTLPRYFSFRHATFKYKYRAPLRRIGQEYLAKVAFSIFQSMKRIFTSGLRWIFHMHSEFSRPAMCNNAIMIISSQM